MAELMASWSWTKKLTLLAVLAVGVTVLAALAGVLTGLATGPAAPPLQGVFADNFTLTDPPAPAPTVEFQTLDGEAASLADYEGGVVLVNFWATWCAPCIREMPSLDRLQAALGPEGLTVLAASIDRRGQEVVAPFLKKLELTRLQAVLDPKGKLFRAFKAGGLPTTYLIDRDGKLVGGLQGPAEWDSPDAQALIRHYLD
jgi:thiol-disulfide isomerase/thioredoxin